MIIALENVSFYIKDEPILNKIDLELKSGLVYCLSGKNGCGKTMLMRGILGLLSPQIEGTVWIDGKQLGKDIYFPPSVGILLENPAFLPSLTGFQNLRLLADLKKEIVSDKDIRNVMGRVGLDPDEKKEYTKYSLGMGQRLGIANAILDEPDLLILDEPMNSLDPEGRDRIRAIIHEERDRGALVLTACHMPEDVEAIADQVIWMDDGRIVKIT